MLIKSLFSHSVYHVVYFTDTVLPVDIKLFMVVNPAVTIVRYGALLTETSS